MPTEKKLQWKVVHNSPFEDEYDFLESVITANGVPRENLKAFLRPTPRYINDPFSMKNMDVAVNLVRDIVVKEKGNVLLKADCDADGYSSSSIMIQFLREINPEVDITYFTSYEKVHGLSMKDMSNYTKNQFKLIIIPDASMMCSDARLIKKNFPDTEILVLDHHLVEKEYFCDGLEKWITAKEYNEMLANNPRMADTCTEHDYTEYCVACNCTDGQYPNPEICGAGVCQKFIEAYIEKFGEEDSIDPAVETKYYDLVSLGCIADAVDLRSLETRYYVMEGLKEKNYNNLFLNELQAKLADTMPFGRYIGSIGWKMAPMINGVIRYGSPDEQDKLLRAIVGEDEYEYYQPRRVHASDPKPEPELQTIQKAMARQSVTVKGRQDRDLKAQIEAVEAKITAKKLDKNSILFVDCTDIFEKKTVTGVAANRIASKYFRPTVILKSKNATEWGGSMRGYVSEAIPDAKVFLESVGVACAGHPNSAGVTVKKSELPEIIKRCNEKVSLDQLNAVYTCDWEINGDDMKPEYVQEVAENYQVFGSTVPDPLFAITNIHINATQIMRSGERCAFIRFTYNGVKYIKKFAKAGEFAAMTMNDGTGFGYNKRNLILTIIGKCELDTYEGKTYSQINIVDFGVQEDKTQRKETPLSSTSFGIEDVEESEDIKDIEESSKNLSAKEDKKWEDIEKDPPKKALPNSIEDFDW